VLTLNDCLHFAIISFLFLYRYHLLKMALKLQRPPLRSFCRPRQHFLKLMMSTHIMRFNILDNDDKLRNICTRHRPKGACPSGSCGRVGWFGCCLVWVCHIARVSLVTNFTAVTAVKHD